MATEQPKGPAPLPAEGSGSLEWWRTQIQASSDKIDKVKEKWRKNLDAYLLQNQASSGRDTVFVAMDFANVEQKKAQLYFRNPEVALTAAPGYAAQADAVAQFGAVLNETLGPDGVDAETAMDELLMDVLCPSGIGVVVLGIEITQDGTTEIQVGTEPGPPPVGSVLGLQAPEVPVMAEVPNIIHQRYFFERESPLNLILPAAWHGSNFDKAPFLGYTFQWDSARAMRDLGLSEEEARSATDQPDGLNTSEKPDHRDLEMVEGQCLFYKGSLYNPDVKHPEEIWRLILVKGIDRVITHDRPYQQYTDDGKTLIGLMGNPVCVYTPRYVSDSALPPSDCEMSRQQVDELSRGRTQMIQQRDRSRPLRQMNLGQVDAKQKDAIERGEYQDIIFTSSSEPIVHEVARATFPRENFSFNDQIEKDVQRTWAFGDNQLGIGESTRRTATELSIQDKRSSSRMEKERNRLAKWYSKTASKLGGLIQLFEDQRETAMIIGPDGVQKMQPWDLKALPLRFVCSAKPDTMVQPDAARDFKQAIDIYQMTANDPLVNRQELVTQLFRRGGFDPSRLIAPPKPPTPDQPKISAAIRGEDLNPASPQFPIVLDILTSGGVVIKPENITLGLQLAEKLAGMGLMAGKAGAPVMGQPGANTTHGGAAEQVHPLSQHPLDKTGQLPGGGADKAPAVN